MGMCGCGCCGASAYGEEDEGAARACAGAGRSGATVTEAARRREDGRSWRQIAAVWMHDGGDVPTEERGDLAWRDIFVHRYAPELLRGEHPQLTGSSWNTF